jgi:hypothetical protein
LRRAESSLNFFSRRFLRAVHLHGPPLKPFPYRYMPPASGLPRVAADVASQSERPAEAAARDVTEDESGSASFNVMFRLVVTVRRGSASNFPAAWAQYPTLDAARVGASALLREDRVLRGMIVSDEVPPRFIEWLER